MSISVQEANKIIEEKNKEYRELAIRFKNVCNDLDSKDKEIDRLREQNNDLRKLYQRTYKYLFEKGNDEMARYFQAQIDECRTFYVEPVIDYFEETKRLNNMMSELRKYIKENAWYDYRDNEEVITISKEKLLELLGSDKE